MEAVEYKDRDEARSVKSHATNQTRESIKQLRAQFAKEKLENREEWDKSVKGDSKQD